MFVLSVRARDEVVRRQQGEQGRGEERGDEGQVRSESELKLLNSLI